MLVGGELPLPISRTCKSAYVCIVRVGLLHCVNHFTFVLCVAKLLFSSCGVALAEEWRICMVKSGNMSIVEENRIVVVWVLIGCI